MTLWVFLRIFYDNQAEESGAGTEVGIVETKNIIFSFFCFILSPLMDFTSHIFACGLIYTSLDKEL